MNIEAVRDRLRGVYEKANDVIESYAGVIQGLGV